MTNVKGIIAAVVLSGIATESIADADANARLAFSDKLSMYSQRIVGSSCAMTSEASPFESRGFQGTAAIEIDRILAALEKGDRALGIQTPEENENILALLDEMNRVWLPIDALSRTIRNRQVDETFLANLEKHIDDFTDTSIRLASVISSQYVDTDKLRLDDAIRIQIVGRQRFLAQKLSFHACSIQKTDSRAIRAQLSETRKFIELSQQALRDGMLAAGLVKTTEPELVKALNQVDRLWAEIRWPILAMESGQSWDLDTQVEMYLKLNELTHEMDKATIKFTKAVAEGGRT